MNTDVVRYTQINSFKASYTIYLNSRQLLTERQIADGIDYLQPIAFF